MNKDIANVTPDSEQAIDNVKECVRKIRVYKIA